ncbi:MAG: trypsin-like peptidase domain-containing protein [Herbinix sp.]|nr:trypsin-like peptidase domain-containing protein [Herbinix sp.]
MDEFNNNDQNQNDNRDNNGVNNPNQYNKLPEYSFWAEQMPSNSYTYYNQGNNTWQYGNHIPNNNASNNVQQPQEKKPRKNVFKFIAKAICFGVIAGLSFIGLEKGINMIYPNSSGDVLSTIGDVGMASNYEIGYTESGTVQMKDRSAINSVTESVIPSIVSINCTSTQNGADFFGQQYSQDVESSGSGIIVAKNAKELLIATNNHVVEGATKIAVTFTDGTEAEAEIKGTDSVADLAVVTVDVTTLEEDTLNAITVAKLGNSDNIKVGEMAIAIGNALGYGQSVTVGYISAKDREVDVSDGYDSKEMVLLQTDAAINPGNSGGALLNVDGEVIGINTVKYADEEVEGMGYAIPISSATPIITELMNREVLSEKEQGYLGIAGYDVTEDASTFYNIPIGVYIDDVTKGGAAEKAGLKAEDIITKVNDLDITSITQLKDKVNSFKVGTEVEITYMRNTDGDYKEAKVTVTLGQNPELANANK